VAAAKAAADVTTYCGHRHIGIFDTEGQKKYSLATRGFSKLVTTRIRNWTALIYKRFIKK
jgi:hypothetical protein